MNTNTNNQSVSPDSQYDSGLKSLVRSLQVSFFILVILILGMLIYFFSFGGYFTVKPQEAVIVLRFGKYVGTYKKGWHWFFPYPVHSFVRVKTNQQYLNIDFNAAEINTGDPAMQNMGGPLAPGRDQYLLTGDANIVHTSWQIGYQIADPQKYYETVITPENPLEDDNFLSTPAGEDMGLRGPQTSLKALLADAVTKATAKTSIESILYGQKKSYQDAVKAYFLESMNRFDIGIEVTSVSLLKAAPPLKTKAAFDAVTSANQIRATLIEKAKAYRIEQENEAVSQQAQILASAENYSKEIVAEVKADSKYFEMINLEYQKNPGTVLVALYNDKLSAVLALSDEKYIITNTAGKKQELRLKINPEPISSKKQQDKTTNKDQ